MPEDRFEERLRQALERPRLAAPTPVQARYRLARASGARRPSSAWFRVGAAFAAGAVAAVVVLSTSTGSANPRVWTMKVVSTFVDLRPEPASTPTSAPTVIPSQEQHGSPEPKAAGSGSKETPGPSEKPEPSEKPGDRSPEPKESSSPSPGSDDHSGSGDGSEHGGASPEPTASPHPES